MDNKLKHLEFIQKNISRLAGYSFLLKGWSVTLVVALFALATKDTNPLYFFLAYFPVLFFFVLDSYFLWQERLFRALYDETRTKKEDEVDFSMDVKSFYGGERTLVRSILSTTILMFYLPLLFLILFTLCF